VGGCIVATNAIVMLPFQKPFAILADLIKLSGEFDGQARLMEIIFKEITIYRSSDQSGKDICDT
jgi:hypothetical protein